MYDEELKGLLKLNKNIKSVWINEEGEWHTSATDGCKEVARVEIIGEETEEVDQEAVNELEVTDPAEEGVVTLNPVTDPAQETSSDPAEEGVGQPAPEPTQEALNLEGQPAEQPIKSSNSKKGK